jgi:hypothetical protein
VTARATARDVLADQLIRPAEAREALRLSPRSLAKLDKPGLLPKIRIPELGLIRYRLSDVERLMASDAAGTEVPR